MSESQTDPREQPGASNGAMMRRLLIVVALMGGFGYAMVPLYKVFCDITGINFLTKPDSAGQRFVGNTQVDVSRSISVEFDVNSHGAWRFLPDRRSAAVHPGELVTIEYELVNTLNRTTTGQAIPSYAPQQAARYFKKVQCFCFNQQTLGPNDRQKFPVTFVIDPDLPADIKTITLSYTYFEIEGLQGKQATAGGSRAAGS
ncbi:MAG: cytochrome c oxidase assembly protein [Burkholderiaceae bacterium]